MTSDMKRTSNSTFTSVTTHGGVFPPEFLQRICDLDKTVKGLTASDYHLPEHRRVSEEANRAWSVLLSDWKAFNTKVAAMSETDPATGVTREQWLLPLFQELGYGRLKKAGATTIEDKDYPVSHFWEQSPIHLVGWNLDLDKRSAGVAGAARFAPHGMVQEFLNRSDDHLWGFVSNGRQLRILRDNVSMTRQAYVEFDLVTMMEGECFSDFVMLWLLCHPSRVEVPTDENGKLRTPEACWLERWSREAETQGARLLDHLRVGVEDAIQLFGSGFLAHPANQVLREKLRSGGLDKQDYYRQLLRLVYRLIFLFVAEDRDLLHETEADAEKKKLYFDHYSTQRIRRIAETKRGSQHRDLWESFKLLFRWLSDEEGCDQLGLTPLGGFLFSEEAMPDLAISKLANVDLLNAVRCLAVTVGDGSRRPVDYQNLGAEELGSIYESLLEMHPNLHLEAATFELDVAAGNERKSTGSYYTPKQLVNCLLDSALDPVVAQRLKQASSLEDKEESLLSMKVCDPACGSGHFLIGASHRIAKHLASVRSGDAEPSPEATRHALRDVITHCIYGVDINPMSVELCKVSLWMEAMEPGKPLGFLDHHIKCGNSLLGTTPALLDRGIPDAAFKAIEGDDKKICAALKKRNKEERDKKLYDLFAHVEGEWSYQQAFDDALDELDHMTDDDLQGVEKKQVAYETFLQSTSYTGGKRLHDTWCAAFVCKKVKDAPVITQQLISEMKQDPNRCPKATRELIDALAEQYQFFHWHIEFPDVFHPLDSFTEKDSKGWTGGFDCMLGNPPWEARELHEREFFAVSRPDIATLNTKNDRQKALEKLRNEDLRLYQTWQSALKQQKREVTLIKNSGFLPLTSRGKLNTYRSFAELGTLIIAGKGYLGFLLKSGIILAQDNQDYVSSIIKSKRLVSCIDFINTKRIFIDVVTNERFALFVVTGEDTICRESTYAFTLTELQDLANPDKIILLSPEEIELLNPNDLSIPPLDSFASKVLSIHIYRRLGVLVNERKKKNPWEIKYTQGHLNSATGSSLFSSNTLESLLSHGGEVLPSGIACKNGEVFLPVMEGKHIGSLNHRFGSYEEVPMKKRFGVKAEVKTPTIDQLQDPKYGVWPRYWMTEKDAQELYIKKNTQQNYVFCFRDVCRAVVDARTIQGTVAPINPFVDNVPLLRIYNENPANTYLLLAIVWSSFVQDFCARQKIHGAHLTKAIAYQLPMPTELFNRSFIVGMTYEKFIFGRGLELLYTSYALDVFARDCGFYAAPFIWDEERRAEIRAELDASLFHLYFGSPSSWMAGVDSDLSVFSQPIDAVEYIMETFPIIKRRDEAKYGTYRTKERILEIYREMARCIVTGEEYKTALNPPPGPPSDAEGNFIPMSEWDTNNWPSHIHRPKDDGAGNPSVGRIEVKDSNSCDDKLYAFSHGVEFVGDDAYMHFEAVNPRDADRIPLQNQGRMAALSKLQTYYAEMHLSHRTALQLIQEQRLRESENWYSLSLSSDGQGLVSIQDGDTEDFVREGMATLNSVNEVQSTRLEKQFALPPVSDVASIKEILNNLHSTNMDTFIAVYDVGQGLCSAICEVKTSIPLLYFDMGCGCYGNAITRRDRKIRFCHTYNPPIILSHWHADHYKGAVLMDQNMDALNAKWLAPLQKVGADAAKFAARLYLKGNILIWPMSLKNMKMPWGRVVRCTGHTLNTSGLALDVTMAGGTHSVLMPGDAYYDVIPDISGKYDSLVVSHHGGQTSGNVISSGISGGTFALPFGGNNTPYNHPLAATLKTLNNSGWKRRLDTDGGHIALGIPLGRTLSSLGYAGDTYDLEIKQV